MSGPDPAGLLDTSVVIGLGRLTPADLASESFISAVTLAELSVGPLLAVTDAERAARVAVLQATEAMFDPLPFDSQSARTFGRVAAGLHTSGRTVRARAYDALIAATALRHQLPVFTRNPADVEGIAGLVSREVR